MALTREQQSALTDLQWHWEDAYLIGYDHQRGSWWARFIGTTEELSASSAEELRHEIRDDYADRKCRREHEGS